jgi:hypothetical protein
MALPLALTLLGLGGLTGAGIGYGVGKKNTPAPVDPVVTNTPPMTPPTVMPPMQAPYVPSSNTTSLVDEAKRQMRNADIISNARFRDSILKTIYGESDYGQFVIDDLATKEEARGNLRAAKQLRAIKNKDGSLPDNARVVFNRLIAEDMDPETASKYAGLPLQISKTESEIVENYQKGQLSAMDTLSKEVRIASAKDKYRAGNREQAIRDIIGLMTEGEIKLEEYITGFERPLTDRELTKIAKQILTGKVGVSDTGVDTSDIVLGIN